MYVQVRVLENRVPILAGNIENHRFGGNSLVVDLMSILIVTIIGSASHIRQVCSNNLL